MNDITASLGQCNRCYQTIINNRPHKCFDPNFCRKCQKHKPTENWVGDGGTLAFVHGAYERWCKCCCLKAQLKHARKLARGIPILEKKLKQKCI